MPNVAVFLGLILATNTFVFVKGLRCWSCNAAPSQAECIARGHIQSCAESCESEVRRTNGQCQITRRCKQRQACENNKRNNWSECKGPNPICRYCCTSDMCNKDAGMDQDDAPCPRPSPIPPSPSPVTKSNRCKRILPPKFGRKTCNFHGFPHEGRIGSKCKFTCNNGYVLEGKMMSFCRKTSPSSPLAYNNQDRSCKKAPSHALRCTLPRKPENGGLKCHRIGPSGARCIFSCDAGFRITGHSVTRCVVRNGRLVWKFKTPECKRKITHFAALPHRPLHGRRTCNGTGEVGTVCEFQCDAGFEIIGNSTTTCVVRDGIATWDSPTPECRLRLRCTTLPRKATNGDIRCPGLGRLGTSCEFSCDAGFMISGSATTTCIVINGRAVWESDTPECNPMRKPHACIIPEDPALVLDCQGDSETGFSSCEIFCEVGYGINGPSTIQCITQGGESVWNSQPPYCAIVGCAEFPPPPENGQRVCDGDGKIGTRCEFLCDPGLDIFGESATKCVVINGKAIWESAVPECKIIKRPLCKVPWDKNAEDWSCRRDAVGNMVCEFSCRAGFVATRETIIRCNYVDGTGVWEAFPPYCTAVGCREYPAEPMNGYSACSGSGEIGTACEFYCDVGYEISGYSTTKCVLKDGEAAWESPMPDCTLSPRCSSFTEVPVNGHVVCSGTGGVGTVCEFSCHDGYEISGSSTVTCIVENDTAIWESWAPTCKRMVPVCKLPNAETFTRLECQGISDIGFTSCQIFCEAGYESRALSTTKCIELGGREVWDLDPPYCTAVGCHEYPAEPTNGYSACSGSGEIGTACGFYCDAGYEISGYSKTKCVLKDGEAAWESPTPKCRLSPRCPSFTEVPVNGHVVCFGTGGVGAVCEFSCHDGYEISGSSTITCIAKNDTTIWESSVPTCERTTPVCRLPNAKTFTRLECHGVSDAGFTSCKISCEAGYESRAVSTINCIERDGREVWDLNPPYCKPMSIRCAALPPMPVHGLRACSGSEISSVCQFSCYPAFTMFGFSTSTCVLQNHTAIWEPAAPRCQIRHEASVCKLPKDAEFAELRCENDPDAGLSCIFSCREGFKPGLSSRVDCTVSNGTALWSSDSPYCTIAESIGDEVEIHTSHESPLNA